jgi:class 3 adenylate cyclase
VGLKKDIIDAVKQLLDEKFVSEETSSVPDISNSKLTFGNAGLEFEATVLYVDMRGSTELLEKHNKPVVAKLHKAYFQAIVTIANSKGGEVRSFNGDSMLVFFQGTSKFSLSNAVQVAMMIKYMISSENGINKLLASYYSTIDFGIGIDDGKILCAKIGLARNQNNQDLIWIGTPVNRSVVISDARRNPANVGISSYVYTNLLDWVKYGTRKDYYGNEIKVDMWTRGTIQ